VVREGEQRKRRRTVPVAGAVIAVVLLAGLTVSMWQMFRAIRASEDETKARQQAFAALRSMTSDVLERKFAQGTVLTDEDRAFLHGVIAQYDAFAAIKADDAESRAVRAEGRFRVAKMRHVLGELQEAEKDFDQAVSICKQLAADFPTVPKYQLVLAGLHNNLGWLLAREKRFAEAFTALDAGLAVLQKLVEAHPKNTEYATHLGWNHVYRGAALVRSGSADGRSKAAADLRRALELWANVPAPHSETRFERSRALALLAGLGNEAKSGVTNAEAAMFADQAVAALRDALSAGWNEPDELKEPEFDSLRGRDDFKKLVLEREAKSETKAKPKD
jgi:tetratricopeptide (TPR) repeat protein